jgi:glycosyltransferase involved in cell wall biosynthesis
LEFMPDMYRVADVVVYPSSAPEPFGLTMLEAFAAARPIIVTDMGGMPEVVQNEITGYVIHQRDFEALADRIITLLANDRLRQRIGKTGRGHVEQHYTKAIMTKEHIRLYFQVLAERGLLEARKKLKSGRAGKKADQVADAGLPRNA